jgi:hypothetical protein
MPTNRAQLRALKNLIEQAELSIDQSPARCRELLTSAAALTDDLIAQERPSTAAAALGRKGGSVTAQKGSDHFRKLAAMRKSHAGGRPRKNPAE